MKKSTLYLMMIVLSLNSFPLRMMAAEKYPVTITGNTNEAPEEVKIMLARLDEINSMDKSNLSRSEKRALRKEVKAINTSLKSSGNGIYLSIGAIVIIVLLLILLL